MQKSTWLILFFLSINLFSANNPIAEAICENQVVPNDSYQTDCKLVENYNEGYRFYRDSSWVTMIGGSIGMAGLGWFIHQNRDGFYYTDGLTNIGAVAGLVAIVAGIWGSSTMLDSHMPASVRPQKTYSLESDTPNLRNGTIDVTYQAVKTVEYDVDKDWEFKPGKTGILWTAGLQLAGASFTGLLGMCNAYLQGDVSRWVAMPLAVTIGSSAAAVIDWYTNPPAEAIKK